jgi:serine protein kinase
MKFVNFFKSAALGYGTEKRVLLLHGPVGSAKSSIARLLKKDLSITQKQMKELFILMNGLMMKKVKFLGGAKSFSKSNARRST